MKYSLRLFTRLELYALVFTLFSAMFSLPMTKANAQTPGLPSCSRAPEACEQIIRANGLRIANGACKSNPRDCDQLLRNLTPNAGQVVPPPTLPQPPPGNPAASYCGGNVYCEEEIKCAMRGGTWSSAGCSYAPVVQPQTPANNTPIAPAARPNTPTQPIAKPNTPKPPVSGPTTNFTPSQSAYNPGPCLDVNGYPCGTHDAYGRPLRDSLGRPLWINPATGAGCYAFQVTACDEILGYAPIGGTAPTRPRESSTPVVSDEALEASTCEGMPTCACRSGACFIFDPEDPNNHEKREMCSSQAECKSKELAIVTEICRIEPNRCGGGEDPLDAPPAVSPVGEYSPELCSVNGCPIRLPNNTIVSIPIGGYPLADGSRISLDCSAGARCTPYVKNADGSRGADLRQVESADQSNSSNDNPKPSEIGGYESSNCSPAGCPVFVNGEPVMLGWGIIPLDDGTGRELVLDCSSGKCAPRVRDKDGSTVDIIDKTPPPTDKKIGDYNKEKCTLAGCEVMVDDAPFQLHWQPVPIGGGRELVLDCANDPCKPVIREANGTTAPVKPAPKNIPAENTQETQPDTRPTDNGIAQPNNPSQPEGQNPVNNEQQPTQQEQPSPPQEPATNQPPAYGDTTCLVGETCRDSNTGYEGVLEYNNGQYELCGSEGCKPVEYGAIRVQAQSTTTNKSNLISKTLKKLCLFGFGEGCK